MAARKRTRVSVREFTKAIATLHAADDGPSYAQTETVASYYDIPEPDWWPRVRALHRDGVSQREIARLLRKDRRTIRAVLDPVWRKEYNAKTNARAKPRVRVRADNQWLRSREIARERWRADGKKRALKWYYRDLDCM